MSVRMNWRLFDRIALAFVVALWLWKLVEYAAREAGWLERSLGWGFYVDFTIPVVVTIVFLAVRQLARLLVRRVPRRLVWVAIIITAPLFVSNKVFAQHDPFMAVVGIVESVSGNLIHVKSGAQLLTSRRTITLRSGRERYSTIFRPWK